MSLPFEAVNYLAVAASAVVIFLLGGAWYTAFFGKVWVKLHGFSEEKVKQMQAARPPALFFTGMIVCYFLICLALALLITSFDIASATGGMVLAVIAWMIVAGFRFTGWLADDRPMGVYLINASFDLLAMLIAGAMLGGWR